LAAFFMSTRVWTKVVALRLQASGYAFGPDRVMHWPERGLSI
jgi:hypothetical protein